MLGTPPVGLVGMPLSGYCLKCIVGIQLRCAFSGAFLIHGVDTAGEGFTGYSGGLTCLC